MPMPPPDTEVAGRPGAGREDMAMINPGIGPGAHTSRIPRPRHGWWRRGAPWLAALACAFTGAGQAQERYDHLDHAVNTMIREIVDDGELREQSVFVGADDFFEEASEFDLRPRLSEMLREKSRTELTKNKVRKLEMVESEAAWVLHGRWWRVTRDSREYLHLRLFIARPVEGDTPPQEHEGEAGLIPIDGDIENAVKPTLRDWGESVVRQLERDLPGTGSYRLHIPGFEVGGAVVQPEDLGRYLRNNWRRAFTGSGRIRVVGPTESDGELVGEVLVTDERVEVYLHVKDAEGQEVAAAFAEPDKGLFQPDFFGPDVEEAAVRSVQEAIGRSELEEAREGLGRLRELNAGHPRLVELEGEIARVERERLQPRKRFRDCPECPELVVVPEGTYMMGSPSSEKGRDDDEDRHEVRIGYRFAVGVKEVTRGEYGRFVSESRRSMGDLCRTYEGGEWKGRSGRNWKSPGFSQTDEHPVVCVSHEDAKAYVDWLSGQTGKAYRLLSEAEWEYMARAETVTARYWGESGSGQCGYANGADASTDFDWRTGCNDGYARTSPVGRYEANGFGLHDVLGNVWEWVEDCWNESYAGAPSDGSAWESGDCSRRVVRGGSWDLRPRDLRSAYRDGLTTGNRDIIVGFRVARTLTP